MSNMFPVRHCCLCLRKLSLSTKSADFYCVNNKLRRFSHSSNVRQAAEFYDVVISGGGMVGAAMAAALGHRAAFEGMKVVQLEAGPEKKLEKLPDKFSNRVSALSPGTVTFLSSFGAWENIVNMRHQPVKKMQVWDSCSDSLIAFNQKELLDDLAFIVENDVTLSAINQQIDKVKDRVEVRYNTKVKGYRLPKPIPDQNSAEHWSEIYLENGQILHARLLVGADGFRSLVRQTADIHTLQWEYNQMGVVATLHLTQESDNNVAWQRFLPKGPIAMLPLSDTASSLVWTTTPEDAKTLLSLPADSFVDAVNNAFWSEDSKDGTIDYATQTFDSILKSIGIGKETPRQFPPTVIDIDSDSRAMFPLGLAHASQYVKTRLALVGDAAHRIHPLAGQGVNLGFGDVACLREVLVKAIHNGADIGELPHLFEYETQRQRHVIPTAATMDGLNRLYRTDWKPVVLLRSLGLQATNALGPIKDQLMGHATK